MQNCKNDIIVNQIDFLMIQIPMPAGQNTLQTPSPDQRIIYIIYTLLLNCCHCMRWGECVFVVIKGEINDVSQLLTKIV